MAKPNAKKIKRNTFLSGSHTALVNAFDLYNEGMILYYHERFARAYALFQLSCEEAGKAMFLLEFFYYIRIYENNEYIRQTTNLDDWYQRFNEVFYYHKEKTKYILTRELHSLNGFIAAFNTDPKAGIALTRDEVKKDLDEVSKFDELKNHSLYTFIDNSSFVSPSEKFTKAVTDKLRFSAHGKVMHASTEIITRLRRENPCPEINLPELEKLSLQT